MEAIDVLERVRAAAEADASGDPVAHGQLLEEIHNLRLAVETPAERCMRMRFQMLENLCIRMALEFGVLQAIAARKGRRVSAVELSKATGTDELLILRTMRLVTYVGVCEETGYGEYASNDTTTVIVTKGYIGGEKHHTDLTFSVGSKLIEIIRGQGLHQFPAGPNQKTPLEYTYGMPLFEFFQHDKEQKEAFDDYMAARRDPNTPQWFQIYPAQEQLDQDLKQDAKATLVVDIGGGFGHEISKFKQSLPNLPGRLVLQDLPYTFDGMPTKPEGIELMPHDFFNAQPVQGARIYYLRNIMHDWPDAKCAMILSNIVDAMDGEYSRILIDDYVLPNTGVDRRAAGMDILMMMFVSGIERTRRQWEELLLSVGLEIVQVWSPKTGYESVIEARVRG